MHIYEIEGRKLIVHDGKLFAEVSGGGLEADAVEEAPARKKWSGKSKSVRTCSKCNQPGHTARTCGRGESPPATEEESEEDLIAKVMELKDQGLDGLRIAAKTKIPLAKIKEILSKQNDE